MFFNALKLFPTEDQQALEDEGIIFPIKSNYVSPQLQPQLPNIYNRNQNNAAYYQSQPLAPPSMPLYSTTVSNSPLTMMNYFNPPPSAFNRNQQNYQQVSESSPQENHTSTLQQSIPIDVVSTPHCGSLF